MAALKLQSIIVLNIKIIGCENIGKLLRMNVSARILHGVATIILHCVSPLTGFHLTRF